MQEKKQKIVFMFPGQGAQYYHMTESLYHENVTFRSYIDEARDVLWDISGIDLIQEVYHTEKRKIDPFDNIRLTQPILLIVSVGIAKSLLALNIEPDLLLGTSLGEYAAAVFSGTVSLSNILKLFHLHWQHFQKLNQSGSMISIMNDLTLEQQHILNDYGYEICAHYMPEHTVIAGPKRNRQYVLDLLRHYGLVHDVLPVNIAFHSSMLDKMKHVLIQENQMLQFGCGQYPTYSAALLIKIDNYQPDFFWHVIRNPIRFAELIASLENMTHNSYYYIDVGPSGTLATFAKKNLSDHTRSRTKAVLTPFSQKPLLTNILEEVC